jgi:uncharacterized protein YoxC
MQMNTSKQIEAIATKMDKIIKQIETLAAETKKSISKTNKSLEESAKQIGALATFVQNHATLSTELSSANGSKRGPESSPSPSTKHARKRRNRKVAVKPKRLNGVFNSNETYAAMEEDDDMDKIEKYEDDDMDDDVDEDEEKEDDDEGQQELDPTQ